MDDVIPPQETEAAPEVQQTIPVERFNEVYKESAENKRMLAEMQQALAQSQVTIANLTNQRQAPQAEAPPDMDPEDQKKIGYYINQAVAPLMQELKSLRAGVGQAQTEPAVNQVQAQLAQINNPAITKRTMELMENLRKRGELGSTYTPAEVLKQAIGEYTLGQLINSGQNAAEQRQYNGNGLMPLSAGGGSQRRAAPAQQQAVASVPLEEMSVDQLAAYITEGEKKNPAGFNF